MEEKNTAIQNTDTSEYYTLNDIMKILHISRSSAYKLVKDKSFPKLYLFRKYLIPKKEFDVWCKEHEKTNLD